MIVTLLEVAGSLLGNMGSKAIPWNLHIWDPIGLYILVPERRSGNLGHIAGPQDYLGIRRSKF